MTSRALQEEATLRHRLRQVLGRPWLPLARLRPSASYHRSSDKHFLPSNALASIHCTCAATRRNCFYRPISRAFAQFAQSTGQMGLLLPMVDRDDACCPPMSCCVRCDRSLDNSAIRRLWSARQSSVAAAPIPLPGGHRTAPGTSIIRRPAPVAVTAPTLGPVSGERPACWSARNGRL